MADPGKTWERTREHDKTKYRWPVLAFDTVFPTTWFCCEQRAVSHVFQLLCSQSRKLILSLVDDSSAFINNEFQFNGLAQARNADSMHRQITLNNRRRITPNNQRKIETLPRAFHNGSASSILAKAPNLRKVFHFNSLARTCVCKGGFPLSRNFYVRTDVNFNLAQLLRLRPTFHTSSLIYSRT